MTYEQSAEPLSFKQKAKRIAIISSYIVVFVVGGMIVPKVEQGFKLFFPDPKPFVAPLSDYEQAVADYAKSPEATGLCAAQAREHVAMQWVVKYQGSVSQEQAKINSYMDKAINGITDAVATQTVALEIKQGRR